jgi:hypothetical protein
MTSQPDYPATDRIGLDEDAPETGEAARDPDLVIVAGEVTEDDAHPNAPDIGYLAGEGLPKDAGEGLPKDEVPEDVVPEDVVPEDVAPEDDVPEDDLVAGETDLGQQWHDIQAMFVDDPPGSVELAAAAAEAAVSALMQTLHRRQSALAPAGSSSTDPGGTEQLREALRGYRIFCQSLSEIGKRLTQPTTIAR